MSKNIYEIHELAANWCMLHDFSQPCPKCKESAEAMVAAFNMVQQQQGPAKFSYVNVNEDGSLTSVIYRLPEIEKHPDESDADFKARVKAHFGITDAD